MPSDDELRTLFEDVLRRMYSDLFPTDEYNRITLFVVDKQAPDVMKPFARYRPHSDNSSEVGNSAARFQKGHGYAGRAWATPHTLLAVRFPGFQSVAEMEEFYKRYNERFNFNMSKGEIASLSEYMTKVRSVLCYGFLDRNGLCNGVLSIDSLDPLVESDGIAEALFAEKFAINQTLTFLDILFDTFRTHFSK